MTYKKNKYFFENKNERKQLENNMFNDIGKLYIYIYIINRSQPKYHESISLTTPIKRKNICLKIKINKCNLRPTWSIVLRIIYINIYRGCENLTVMDPNLGWISFCFQIKHTSHIVHALFSLF